MIRAIGLVRDFTTGHRRRRRTVHAVDGIDLTVSDGETVALLGPNGAGKTTTMRMLTTLDTPTCGEILIGDLPVTGPSSVSDAARARRLIGYVPQGGGTNPTAHVLDEIVDHAMLYGLSRREATGRTRDLLSRLTLTGLEERPCAALSGGRRRRVDLAAGLAHRPRLLILDEPSVGLDPQARADLWELVTDLRRTEGLTVLFSTHYLEEAADIADRVVFIDRGRVVADGVPDQLIREICGEGENATLDDVFRTLTGTSAGGQDGIRDSAA